jgi:phenylpropionate dioxygenase-like ring-hydroxylating dioxygenase large terminal subunit
MIPDQWYAVLETDEVKQDKPVAFKRLNENLVFWRDSAGKVYTQRDVCPHRQAKLSAGKVVGNNIQCPFHGFEFNGQGACQVIPANGKNGPRPKIFQVKSYPTREAHGFIWVWNGESRAEEDYPPLPFFDGLEEYSYGTLRRHWATHYTRAIENQLDLAHLPFVHYNTIGRGGRTLVDGPYTELTDDNSLYVWINLAHDKGQLPIRPSAMQKPNQPWGLCFKFPNIWMLNISEKFKITVAFAPIDDENTLMYVRGYHNFVKSPLLRRIISKIGAPMNARILKQDEAVVMTQPKQTGLDSGDHFIPADRPIVQYHTRRQELIEQSQRRYLPEIEFRAAGD